MSNDVIAVVLKMLNAKRFQADARDSSAEIAKIGTRSMAAATGVAVVAQSMGALGLSSVALVASLAPVLGLVGTLPALGALAGQGLGVVKFGLMGVKDALGGLNGEIDLKKFEQLSGPAQDFVIELAKLKQPIRDLQKDLQAGLFPGFTRGLHEARPAIAALHDPLVGTSEVLGNVAAQLGVLVGSGGFLRDLSSQATFNNKQLTILGGAGLHVVNMFRNLMVVTRPLVAWLVRLVSGWAATADKAVAAGRASGDLAKIFNTVQVTTWRVLRLFWRLGVALFNIGAIGKRELGDGILVGLLESVTALEKWTQSEKGINDITQAFRWARDTIKDVGDFLSSLSDKAGPGMADLLRNLVDAINPILASGGAGTVLALYASGLNAIVGAVVWGNQHIPGFSTAMSALFAVLILNKTLGLVSFVASIYSLARAFVIAAAGTRLGATAFWALNAAMTANPIGLIVVGIAAVIAVFVLLYTKVRWFRNAVNNTWSWIRANWPLLLKILTGPIGFAVGFIISKWSTLKSAATNTAQWIRNAFNNVVAFFKALPGRVGGAFRGMWNGLKEGFRSAINFIIRGWNGLEFKVPGVKLPGPLPDIPGFTVGVPDIPLLASGGIATSYGAAIVGDNGPELLSLVPGARIDPLPDPTVQRQRSRGRDVEALGDFDTERLAAHFHLYIDGKEVAVAVKRHAESAKARR